MMKDCEKQIYIDAKEELDKYDLDGKWNDYIAVQKEVLRVLREAGFFSDNTVCNGETGMLITISPKDIRETFGNGNKFQRLPRTLKEYKVVTIGSIKEIIKEARLLADNVENIHMEQTDTFAYFRKTVFIERNIEIIVRISVKKRAGSNHFHIHHIDVNENSLELLGPSHETDIFETQDYDFKLTEE